MKVQKVMNYKKYISNQNLRFRILKFLSFLPDSMMLKLQYKIKSGNNLSLKHPRRFTEWLQWYKINYRNPVLHECVDKYEVHKYVERKGLKAILNKIHGVYADASQIDFNSLPDRFVAKTTDGGGGQTIIICKDKKNADFENMRNQLNSWLDRKSINAGREWAYTKIKKSQIIIEDFLENPLAPVAGIEDYKIMCFAGVPKIIIYDCDRYIEHKRNIYDTEWNRIYVDSDCMQKNADIPKPKNFEYMLDVASKLSEDFPYVRVDLYNIEGRIVFGELTFYPWSGYVNFNPDSFDFQLGDYFKDAIMNWSKKSNS